MAFIQVQTDTNPPATIAVNVDHIAWVGAAKGEVRQATVGLHLVDNQVVNIVEKWQQVIDRLSKAGVPVG